MDMNSNKKESESEITIQKEQVTFYLPSEIVEGMEEIRFNARKRIPRSMRNKLSKSQMYTLLLEEIIKDYTTTGNESFILQIISNWGEN